jgi:uncharacterized protein YbjT (DUF2867 family)
MPTCPGFARGANTAHPQYNGALANKWGTMASKKRPRTVLVAGATGYRGGEVVKVLHGAGHRVRALARDPKRLGELRDLCDDVFVAEVTQPDTLTGICDGVDAVFTSVGVRTMKRKPTFWDVDCQGNLNLLEQARIARVRLPPWRPRVSASRSSRRGPLRRGTQPPRAPWC